jgi:drug/metabolite transporter (DMT)-like permease
MATGKMTSNRPPRTVAALQETSVLFALIGALILRERLGWVRISAATLITLGIILIANVR